MSYQIFLAILHISGPYSTSGPLGEKIDYNFHQAMFEVPTNDSEPGIVVEVSQKGYLLHDRLVRPAMVGISKKIEDVEIKDKKTDEI